MNQPLTPIYQSNTISNSLMIFRDSSGAQNLNLWQQKIIATIILFLQPLVRLKMQGKSIIEPYPQELNYDPANATFRLNIDLNQITTSQNYRAAYEALEMLQRGFQIILPSKNGKRETISMVIIYVDRPKLRQDSNYKDSMLHIELAKRPALAIADIAFQSGKAVEFTKWYYEVSMNAKSKYTQKFYWLIAAWRHSGVFKIELDELKTALGVGTKEYEKFYNFKKRVLLPISIDLQNSDCPIDLENGITYIKGEKGKIKALEFKIVNRKETIEEGNLYVQHIMDLLKKYFKFKTSQVDEILPLLLAHSNADEGNKIILKLSEILDLLKNNKIQVQQSLSAYVIQALKNLFS